MTAIDSKQCRLVRPRENLKIQVLGISCIQASDLDFSSASTLVGVGTSLGGNSQLPSSLCDNTRVVNLRNRPRG